jgi:ketosteroid isomerase-like protein
MTTANEELVRSSFDAFLRGDWDALAKVLAPDVEWLWHEPGDWDCHDRKKVLSTLTGQDTSRRSPPRSGC